MGQDWRGALVLMHYPSSTGAQRFLLAADRYDGYDTWAAGTEPRHASAVVSFSIRPRKRPENVNYPPLRPFSCSQFCAFRQRS
jgi:hypothetical protein